MGGRGQGARRRKKVQRLIKPPVGYTVITPATLRAGAAYPFFEGAGRRWSLVSVPLDSEVQISHHHTLGMETPTLVWFSDNNRKELYVDGMTTEEFCGAVGIEFSLGKGAAVLSKRMSRVLRPYKSWGWFDAEQVQVSYLEQSPRAAKVWDGAGLIDRRMLRKLPTPEGMDADAAHAWRRKLLREGRVEFTIQHAGGQDKGHAIVVHNLRDEAGKRVDFLLPRDTKREVTLGDGVFVGVNPVHSKDDLRLDVQSFVNTSAFWGREDVVEGAYAELQRFEAAVAGNTLEDIGMQLGKRDEEEGDKWHLQAFWEAGGDIRWSPHLIKAVFDQHLKRLDARVGEKVRLPLPGGRYYVMPQGIGQRGGLDLQVERGAVQIDPDYGTAWVNDEDWLSLSGAHSDDYSDGIATILGGADNDDGLWLSPFTDEGDAQKKFLVWRSPNQMGEYVTLTPTSESHLPQWHGEEVWPERDSRSLPTRADKQTIQYLEMVDHDEAGGMGQGEAYSIATMQQTQSVLLKNQGGLELYCNATMRHVAMYGGLPSIAPARLEDVVDSKKTGADVSGVKQWCYEDTNIALARGDRVPRRLLGRLARERGRDPLALDPPPLLTRDHWLDRFDSAYQGHIQEVKQVRDRLMQQAQPPEALLEAVAQDEESRAAGARFNQLYASTVKRLQKREYGISRRTVADRVQQEVQAEIRTMPLETRRALLIKVKFDKAWYRLAQTRGNGAMREAEYTHAVAEAHKGVAGLEDRAVTLEVQQHLRQQAARRIEAQQRRGLSREALDEVRETMEAYLGQWSPERQRAVLRGAMVSVVLNARHTPGTDADGVWLMGEMSPDGTRTAGIAQQTIEALTEIGVMGEGIDKVLLDALRGV